MYKPKPVNVLPMRVSREILRRDIDAYRMSASESDVGEQIAYPKISKLEWVPFASVRDEVEADACVFGALVELRVICKLNCALAVDKDLLGRMLRCNMRAYRDWIHMSFLVASETPMYSVSTVKEATRGCLRVRQVTAPPGSIYVAGCRCSVIGISCGVRVGVANGTWWLWGLMRCAGGEIGRVSQVS